MEDTYPINSIDSDILWLIGGYLIKKNSEYQLIDQRWMLNMLDEWYNQKIARSTLCHHLRKLVVDGMLRRITRHRRNPETGKFEPRVTCYSMTFKLRAFFLQLAARMRSIGWKNYITKAKRQQIEEDRKRTRESIEAQRLAAIGLTTNSTPEEARRSFWSRHYPERLRT